LNKGQCLTELKVATLIKRFSVAHVTWNVVWYVTELKLVALHIVQFPYDQGTVLLPPSFTLLFLLGITSVESNTSLSCVKI
jgi:hypothetical protein